MECDICRREHHPQRLPFLCPVDARNQIYDTRMKNLQLLVQNESLQKQIGSLLTDMRQPSADAVQDMKSRQRLIEDRTTHILAAADKLKEDISAARDEIKSRRAVLAKRKSDMASITDGLLQQRDRRQAEVQDSIMRRQAAWAEKADDSAGTRRFLCKEAAGLYGLRRVKREGSDGGQQYDYYLGRLPVVDLTSMNSPDPEVISTSLAHVSHLLVLTAHYLSIRLPAEITLPHRDYPRTTIFNLSSSYRHGDVSFPTTPGSATPTTSSDPRTSANSSDSQHIPRPRPLFIDKGLSQLAKEDLATYSFFLEGVTLLAYNVAWLCGTQGFYIDGGDKGLFEEVCDLGKNLYTLLGPRATPSSMLKGPKSPAAVVDGLRSVDDDASGAAPIGRDDVRESLEDVIEGDTRGFGRLSHGSTFYFLGGVEGSERMKAVKLPSPMKLADKLKKKLVGDAPDWEILDDAAWKVDGEDATVEPGLGNGQQAEVKMEKGGNGKGSPQRQSNGWMKVKSR